MHRKGLVIGILILMLGVNIGSTFAGDVEVKIVSPVCFDGNTLYVGGSGPNNYTTIQSAIDDAVDGDTVFVFDDSSPYYENVVVDKSINLIGENKETTIIDGGASGNVIFISSLNVHLSGFTVFNCGDWNANIFMDGAINCSITDNIIIGNEFGLIDGIEIEYSDGNTIKNNSITNFYQSGIHLYVSSHNVIEGNVITSCYYRGILIHYFSSNNSISGNTCIETGNAIEFHTNSQGNIAFENTLSNSRECGIFFHKVVNNYAYNNEVIYNPTGIGTHYSHGNFIYSNMIANNSKGFSCLQDSYANTISNNTIKSNNIGISTLQSTSNEIINNDIINNEKGIDIDSLSDSYYIIQNNIKENIIGIQLVGTTENNISSNLLEGNENGILLRDESMYNLIFSNYFSENIVNGINAEFCSFNEITYNTFIDNKAGIVLTDTENITILENTFTRNTYGIQLKENANKNTINKNIIQRNKCGIYAVDSIENMIIKNELIANRGFHLLTGGIFFLRSFNNTVHQNNFKRNFPNARFIISNNTWSNNYWNRPRVSKKSIFGIGSDILPWVNYDYNPSFFPLII